MSIKMMVGREKAGQPNVVELRDFPGAEAGRVRHGNDCPHAKDGGAIDVGCEGHHCWAQEPLYIETTYQGMVLAIGEHNHYDDSDFYAIVWDAEKGEAKEIEYASTRGWSYPNSAVVDAGSDVQEAHLAYLSKRAADLKAVEVALEDKTPGMGKRVKVV